jgi:hypothetical protein
MPLFEQQFFEYLKKPTINTMGYPLVLGGVSTSGGGGGGPAGGFVGMLPQTKITFDWLEDDTTDTIPTLSASLYDNLNRIRYRIKALETTVSGGTGGGHVIEEEGTPLTQRANLNFVGDGVFVTDDGVDTTIVTISGGGHTIEEEGSPVTQRVNLNFVGDGVTVTDDGVDTTTVTIPAVTFSGDATPVTLDVNADTLLSLSTQELGLDIQGANELFAGPTTGADDVPSFRTLVAADLGTGSPTGSKFLRDDLSWQLPPTSSGGSDTGALVPGVFIASYFDESNESLHLYKSLDGLTWEDAATSYADTVRDPSLLWYGGLWWIAHTHNGAPTDVIPILSSPDLIVWTSVVELDTSAMAGTGVAWAPEWFVDDDGSVHLFIANGNAGDHVITETHPTNAGWTTWSNLVEVTGTGFPNDMIDAFVVKIDSTYYLWYKDDDTDDICYATSTSLTSGYTEIEDGDWAGFGSGYEGECLVKIDEDTWRIYYNVTLTNGLYYSESSDTFATWSAPASLSTLASASHGTVLQVSDFAAFWSASDFLGYGGTGTVTEVIGTAKIGVSLSRSSSLSIPDNNATAITWNNEIRDDGDCWDVGSPTELRAPIAGWYAISAFTWWDADSDYGRRLYIRFGGVTTIGRQGVVSPAAHNDPTNSVSAIYYMEADEYVEIIALQNAGNALNIKSGAMAQMARVGGAAHIIQDSGAPTTLRSNLNFTGSGIIVTDDEPNDATVVTFSGGGVGGGHTIQDDGTPETQRTNLNFTGTGVTVTDDEPNDATVVTFSGGGVGGGHTIQYSGVPETQRTNLNFTGSGVFVYDDGGDDSTVIEFTSIPGPSGTPGATGPQGIQGPVGPSGAPGTGHVIEDNGTPFTQRANLNFIGATVEDDAGNDATKVTFSGGTGSGTIDGAGVANRIALWSGASTLTESNHLQIDTVGDIIRLGDQIRPSIYGTGIRIVGSDQTQEKAAYLSLRTYDDSASCDNEFGMWRSRGTSASPTALEDDDCIGRVIFLGQHGAGEYDYAMGIAIAGYAAENLSSTNRGTELRINVTTAGQASQMDKEYLFRDGDLDVPDNFRSDGLFGRRSTNGKDVTMTAGYSWVVAGDYTIDDGTTLELETDAIMEII